MKIVHICISAPYIDGWGYQENLLPKYLNYEGTENHVIASYNDFPEYLNKKQISDICEKGLEYDFDGIKIHRIKTTRVTSSLLITHNLYKVLKKINPDVIFHHNINSTTLSIASLYSTNNKCLLFVDNHADEINMSNNKLWIFLYHKFCVRLVCKSIQNVVCKFYGVTLSRCHFINKYYHVCEQKIELLPIGADTNYSDTIESISVLRNRYGYTKEDCIIVSGGKMGIHKGTDKLIEAIEDLNNKRANIKLILFGKFEDEYSFKKAQSLSNIKIFEWCDRKKTLELLKLSDIACWPIHHTTLIEDAISVCTPLILRKTTTTEHLIDNNGIWLNECSKDGLSVAIEEILEKKSHFPNNYKHSCEDMKNKISYQTIARMVMDSVHKLSNR